MRSITEFHENDVVIIRDFDDMASEYGLNASGDIQCKCTFVREMSIFCGIEMVVKIVTPGGSVHFVEPAERMDNFYFSTDMIRHIDDPEYEPVPEEIPIDEFFDILS